MVMMLFVQLLDICGTMILEIKVKLTGGDAVADEFVISRHAFLPTSFDLLWQHASIVQKPTTLGSYCLDGYETI